MHYACCFLIIISHMNKQVKYRSKILFAFCPETENPSHRSKQWDGLHFQKEAIIELTYSMIGFITI